MKITHQIANQEPGYAGRVLVGSRLPISKSSVTEVILFTGEWDSKDEIVLEGSLEELKASLIEALAMIDSLEREGARNQQGGQCQNPL